MTKRLVDCRPGERVMVGTVEGTGSRVDRLASLGVLPGVELVLQQTRPVVVVECDETVLALEREIAHGVLVHSALDVPAADEDALPKAAE